MPAPMIDANLPRALTNVTLSLERVALEHHKCLACHCYREVAEEAVASVQLILDHGGLVEGGLAPEVQAGAERLRTLLASIEGTHG